MANGSSGGQSSTSLRDIIQEELAKTQQSGKKDNGSSGSLDPEQLRQIVRQELASMSQNQGSNTSQNSSNSNSGQGNSSNNQSSASGTNSNKSKKAQVKPKTSGSNSQSQTVAQVLTQAQYELSQELEANLKKLRSVIQQSEEIAKKIELVLGRGEKGSGKQE
ncbi:MAG: hypothetical protein C7B46_04190 [Sulfobacillus benefaciens]|uniref:Uncharacterized protein n=1 Tax=Sulfobacillus benefaciens TaxID=453960 RepID=A0A2T2XJI2_9FIRM|nr:MAG: hypothetical protein C7B46_04190 [Sulfobacillus benefaciens]